MTTPLAPPPPTAPDTMVSRYTTTPIELPEPTEPFSRADLIFYGLDHSQASFEGRIFIDNPRADVELDADDASYAGSFWIFGHGGCFGDVGHCDISTITDPFDLRPPHQLTPGDRVVTLTESVARLAADGRTEMTVTVVAHVGEGESPDVLAFDKVRLATYVGDPAFDETA
jgi:hypothetical protein